MSEWNMYNTMYEGKNNSTTTIPGVIIRIRRGIGVMDEQEARYIPKVCNIDILCTPRSASGTNNHKE